MPKKPNVLVVIVDQLRADCVEGALAEHVNLPNIRAFQRDAVTFSNHFSVTNPCGPSRASIFTGRYAMNHRSIRNGTPLAHDTPNIALEMRKSGYDPLLFGYTDVSPDPRIHHPNDPTLTSEEGLLPGFREIVEARHEHSYPWRAHLKSKGYNIPKYRDFYDQVSLDPNRETELTDPPFYKAEDSDTAFLTDQLLKDLAVKTDETWAAFTTYIRPHPPLVAPEPYNKMYEPADLPLPERKTISEECAVHPFLAGAMNATPIQSVARGFSAKIDPDNDQQVNTLRALYLGLATEVDMHFGRIIKFLKDSGQYDDTLILLMADHGEMLGDHHLWGKQVPYDPAYRIPLIIRDPRNAKQFGTSVDVLTETVDFMPTVLDLLGHETPEGVDGYSLKPFLEGETPEIWRQHVHMEQEFGEPDKPTKTQEATGTGTNDSNFAIIRETRFKLVHFNGGLSPLLFDLENDPLEMNDLAKDPAHMPTLLRLTQKLLSHRMRHTNRFLTNVRIRSDGSWNFRP